MDKNLEELKNTYEIYEQIGEGGSGMVYRAFHKRLQKMVILKKISNAGYHIQNYRTEVDILKDLHHAYLPQVYDFIETPEGIYTVMEFIHGESMRQIQKKGVIFREKEVLKYACQLCEALAYLHSHKPVIIHGDIKPDNVMLTPEGNVYLIDFNISGFSFGEGADTQGCTPGYSSPEQVKAFEELKKRMGNKKSIEGDCSETVLLENADLFETVLLQPSISNTNINERSDIFSLGATLYTLLTGKVYQKGKEEEIPEISNGFFVILKRALEEEPEKRYANAIELLQAFNQVHKKDRRYRQLILKQNLFFLGMIVFIIGSVYLMVSGRKVMSMEYQEQYDIWIEELQEGILTKISEENFENIYQSAIKLYPKYLAAYFEKAYYLVSIGAYQEAISFITPILSEELEGTDEIWSNLYYLYGECYFRIEDFKNAAASYQMAIRYQDKNPEIYRDYAISFIYLGEIEQARSLLKKAVDMGLEQADIYMVQGEIERITGNVQEAIPYFKGVLEETQDEYLRQRAYIMASKAFEEIGTKEAIQMDIAWLNQAVKELAISNRLLIYERMVKDYIQMGEMEEDDIYYKEAIKVLNEIVVMNWDTYQTYSNIVVLYMRMRELDNAEKWLQEMQGKYPDYYVTWMRMAYLEIEIQNTKESKERDYHIFAEYYERAKEYYEEQISGNVTDAQMQYLERLYQQIKEGGWLE